VDVDSLVVYWLAFLGFWAICVRTCWNCLRSRADDFTPSTPGELGVEGSIDGDAGASSTRESSKDGGVRRSISQDSVAQPWLKRQAIAALILIISFVVDIPLAALVFGVLAIGFSWDLARALGAAAAGLVLALAMQLLLWVVLVERGQTALSGAWSLVNSANSTGASETRVNLPTPRTGFEAVDDVLAAPFESTHHDVRGGIAIEYLTGEQVISRLLAVLGSFGWSFRVLQHDIHLEADEVSVLGELRLHLNPDDPVVRQQFGSSKIKRARTTGAPLDIGFDLKAAAADCLKKMRHAGRGWSVSDTQRRRTGTRPSAVHGAWSQTARPATTTKWRRSVEAWRHVPSEEQYE
jgi:hypothetical protein